MDCINFQNCNIEGPRFNNKYFSQRYIRICNLENLELVEEPNSLLLVLKSM